MNSDRDQILSRVRDALAPLPQRAARPDWEAELVKLRLAQPATDAWAHFAERFAAVNGTALPDLAAFAAFVERQGWTRGYCDPAIRPAVASVLPAGVALETSFDRTRVDDYQFAVTQAAAAIAETGTLVLTDATTSSRLAALAPWGHFAVVRPATIFPDISAALAALPADPNIVWVTGPSKTADVEGILIEGVHGPGIQGAIRWE